MRSKSQEAKYSMNQENLGANRRAAKSRWRIGTAATIAAAVLVCAVLVAYFVAHNGSSRVIATTEEATRSCQVALKSHLADMKQTDTWQTSSVTYDKAADRWLCTLNDQQGRRLFIIIKPQTGGFEVSVSN